MEESSGFCGGNWTDDVLARDLSSDRGSPNPKHNLHSSIDVGPTKFLMYLVCCSNHTPVQTSHRQIHQEVDKGKKKSRVQNIVLDNSSISYRESADKKCKVHNEDSDYTQVYGKCTP